jgi:hypothetical protein
LNPVKFNEFSKASVIPSNPGVYVGVDNFRNHLSFINLASAWEHSSKTQMGIGESVGLAHKMTNACHLAVLDCHWYQGRFASPSNGKAGAILIQIMP